MWVIDCTGQVMTFTYLCHAGPFCELDILSVIFDFFVFFPADSMFFATISERTISVNPGEAIIWDSAPINPGGYFNTILGVYTAPVTGYYTWVKFKIIYCYKIAGSPEADY